MSQKNLKKNTYKKASQKYKKPFKKNIKQPLKKEVKITKSKIKNKKTKEKPHHLKITNDPFVKGFLTKSGFYKYVHFPFFVVVVTLLVTFFYELYTYTRISPADLTNINESVMFLPLMIIITLVCLFSFLYLGYKGAEKNFLFNKMFYVVVNLVCLIATIEIILTFIGFMTFLAPFVVASFENVATQKLYLFYLISWVFVKSVFYLFMTSLSYLVFYKLRFVKYKM
jgi:hypothetical protein